MRRRAVQAYAAHIPNYSGNFEEGTIGIADLEAFAHRIFTRPQPLGGQSRNLAKFVVSIGLSEHSTLAQRNAQSLEVFRINPSNIGQRALRKRNGRSLQRD